MERERTRYHAMARMERHGGFVFKDFDSWDSLLVWLMAEARQYYNVFIQKKEDDDGKKV